MIDIHKWTHTIPYHTKHNVYTNYSVQALHLLCYIYPWVQVDLMHRATDRHTDTGEERSHTLHEHCTYTHIQKINTDTVSLVSKGWRLVLKAFCRRLCQCFYGLPWACACERARVCISKPRCVSVQCGDLAAWPPYPTLCCGCVRFPACQASVAEWFMTRGLQPLFTATPLLLLLTCNETRHAFKLST